MSYLACALVALAAWAQAYRHFLKPANGRVFLRRVLDRQVLIED